LLSGGEVSIFGVFFSIGPLNEGNGVLGTSNLGKNHLAFLQSPSGFNGIFWMWGEPEVVVIEMVESDGLAFLDTN